MIFESLFTNIPIQETINYIIETIYVIKSWHQFVPNWFSEDCWENLLQNLLLNSITDLQKNWMVVLWEDQYLLLLSDNYMIKMENDVVIPSKSIFYRRVVDGIYSRQKLGDNVLFGWLNSYHPNIKLTIEVNANHQTLSKFSFI